MSGQNYAILRKSIYGKLAEISKTVSSLEDRIETLEKGNHAYMYGMWESNTLETDTTTLNQYKAIVYPDSPWVTFHNSGVFDVLNDGGHLCLKYTGAKVARFLLCIDFNGYKTQGNSGQYQFEMRINGFKAGPSPANKFDAINKWQMLSITGMPMLAPGFVLTFHVRNIKDTDPIIVSRLSLTIFEI